MKTFVKIIAAVSVFLGLAACQQYKIDTQMTPEKAAAGIKLVCDALDSYDRPATSPATITFNISSNTPWTITRSSGADWCDVSPSSSAESALISDIVVTLENNNTLEDRSATLTIMGDNISGTKTITIKQDRLGRLYVTPVAQNYSAAGGPLTFTINTNVDWEVRADVSWLSFNRESGSPDPDGRTMTITATAEANESIARTGTITVSAGDDEESFNVTQNGFTFEIVAPSKAELPREGGSLTLEVNTTATWTPATDNAAWTVEKTDDTHFKVTAPYNNSFAVKTGKVSISTANGAYDELSLAQDVNFTFEGNYEILADGSVKITGDQATRVTTKDTFRYIEMTLTMGDCNFASAGQLWVYGNAGGCNIYNQLTVGGNTRVRTDGTYYKSTSYSITLDELNSMTSYGVRLSPAESDATQMHFEFLYNGELRGEQTGGSPFSGNTDETKYWFGYWSAGDANTTYVVKTCDITVIEG